MDIESETLKHQFKLLETQSNKRLEKMKERQQKKKEREKTEVLTSKAFGVEDDMGLQLSGPHQTTPGLSEDLVQHLNDQIRNLTDENGRLYKLLSERDLEMRSMKKKLQHVSSVPDVIPGDAAAAKIVELSKKVREMTSEMERERNGGRQAALKARRLQQELDDLREKVPEVNNHMRRGATFQVKDQPEVDVEALQQRLKESERRNTELRNTCESLKKDVKVAHKVLQSEVGDDVSVQSLLSGGSTWKGRHEMILRLQNKVSELKNQLGKYTGSTSALREEMTGSGALTSSRSSAAERRQREQLWRLEKERKEQLEQASEDLKVLSEDHAALQKKQDAAKARNKVLAQELKGFKQQVQTLLKKGKHDDELVQALMAKQEQMKTLVQRTLVEQQEKAAASEGNKHKASVEKQKEKNITQQMQAIISEKEDKIKIMEAQLEQLREKCTQLSQRQQLSSMFDRPSSRGSLASSRPGTADWSRPGTGANRSPEVYVEVIDGQTTLEQPAAGLPPRPYMAGTDAQGSARGDPMTSGIPLSRSGSRSGSRTGSRLERPSSRRPQSAERPPSTRPPSGVSAAQLRDYEVQLAEAGAMLRATEVERDRLKELVSNLQARADAGVQEVADSQAEAQRHRQVCASLERQLGRAQLLEKGKGSGRRGMGSSVDLTDNGGQGSLEELKTNLAIQRDENEALRSALHTTLAAKEQDMGLYQKVIEETRKVFIAGLRQFKAKAS